MIFNVQKLLHITKIFMHLKAKFNILVCPKLMYKDSIATTHYIKVQYKETVLQGETIFHVQDILKGRKYNKV